MSWITPPQTFTQYAELAIQCAGLGLLVVLAVELTWRRAWGTALRLPAHAEHRIEPVDLMLAFLAFFYFGPLLAAAATGGQAGATSAPSTAPVESGLPTLAQIAASMAGRGLGIVVLVALGCRRFAGGRRGWGMALDRPLRDWLIATGIYVAFWPVCTGLVYATQAAILHFNPAHKFDEHTAIQVLRESGGSGPTMILTALDAVLLAPWIEELFFRGLLQPALARWWRSDWAAIAFCGAAFGAIHLNNLETVPALALFGVVLGVVYVRTGRLSAAIALHMVFNIKTIAFLMIDQARM